LTVNLNNGIGSCSPVRDCSYVFLICSKRRSARHCDAVIQSKKKTAEIRSHELLIRTYNAPRHRLSFCRIYQKSKTLFLYLILSPEELGTRTEFRYFTSSSGAPHDVPPSLFLSCFPSLLSFFLSKASSPRKGGSSTGSSGDMLIKVNGNALASGCTIGFLPLRVFPVNRSSPTWTKGDRTGQ
jgi:hypothetical protein